MFHFHQEARLLARFLERPRQDPVESPQSPSAADNKQRLNALRQRVQQSAPQEPVAPTAADDRARLDALKNKTVTPEAQLHPANTPATLELGPTEQARVIIPGINPPILVHRNFVRTQNDPTGRIKFNVERKRNGDKYTVTASASVAGLKIERV
ncbi:MAG: hypothetical protein ABL890_00350 [Candidatus Peribacteraceae bacterium]